ncbi:MAG: amidohydrolase [Aggregatilineales bacterium]
MDDFRAQAEALRQELIERRRDFHRYPELAFQEVRTASIVAEELARLGLEVQTGIGKTGVVGILEGTGEGPTVLIRADMDALPVQEENEVDYVSQTPGVMHACGHDGHTAIALGVAKLLAAQRNRLCGRVKFVFQPAEEIGRGAQAMAEDGVLNDPRPDVSLGLHLWNSLPLGKLGVADGPIMAGSATFTIHIAGKGGHAAIPQVSADPVLCAAQLITALHSIISRNVDPLENAVLSVTSVTSGHAFNVIPQTADLKGTVRYYQQAVRDRVYERMQDCVQFVARAMGCTGTLKFTDMTLPVHNHPQVTARARRRFAALVGEEGLDTTARTMGSEDVGLFMHDIPGMYFFLGAADSSAEVYYGHHHPRFTFDENALSLGVALLASAAADYVLPE